MKFAFADFWPKWDWSVFYVFNEILPEICEIEIVEEDPDILFFSVFGNDYQRYRCPKVFYTAENRQDTYERLERSDWSFSHHVLESDSHYRLPNWLILYGLDVLEDLDRKSKFEKKERFCSFLYSNPYPQERKDFFKKLSAYKVIDSGGSVFNNLDGRVPPGQEKSWKSQYKFSIDFENQSVRGYTTEKIISSFLANTVPIYWGNPEVEKDFNKEAFINARNFSSFNEVVDYTRKVDQDDSLYREIQTVPALKETPSNWKKSKIKNRLEEIINGI